MDLELLDLLNQRLACPLLDDLMLLASAAGLVLLPGLGLWLLAQRRQRRLALVLLGALAAALAATLALQWLVARPRPEGVRLLLPAPAFDAYPSGHAALAWCAALLLALAWRRRAALIVGPLAATLISLSRVYLGHHHPSDVLGGALLGAGIGALFYGLWLAPRGPRLRWALWPQLALVLMITQMAYLGLLPRGWDLGLPGADKLLHFVLFGLLAFWLHLWLGGRRVRGLPLAPMLVLGGASLEELCQALSPRRTADLLDLLCDVGGVLLFVALAQRVVRRAPRPRPS